MTSPIPSEDALSTSRHSTGPASLAEDTQTMTMNDPAVGSVPTVVRKRKRRRKKHKGDPRREEQAAVAAGGGEPEPCELSSDEENGGQWCVGERTSSFPFVFGLDFLSFVASCLQPVDASCDEGQCGAPQGTLPCQRPGVGQLPLL